jgi:signal transduction histidine kinase
VQLKTSRHASRSLERASLLAALEAGVAARQTTRLDTVSVMAAIATLLAPDASQRFGATASGAAAVRRMLTPLSDGRKLAVDVVPTTVRFERTALERVLLELVDNALRHAPAGSTVRVRGAEGAGGYQLSVTNAGAPLPRWVLAALRPGCDPLRAGEPDGASLGLSIASVLAALNGARLEVLRGAGRPNTLRIIARPA